MATKKTKRVLLEGYYLAAGWLVLRNQHGFVISFVRIVGVGNSKKLIY